MASAPARQVERARQQPPPRRGRPAQGDGQQHDVVAAVVVALEVEVARRLASWRRGPGARRCPRSAAGRRPGRESPRCEEVAAPQQRVGVEVGDPQPRVERPRPVGRAIRRPAPVTHRRASVRADHPPAADPGAGVAAAATACRRADADRRPRLRRATVTAGRPRPAWAAPDLVEEGQRPGVALERDADELAQRGLGLALDVGREPQRRDRLDVEALVGLEQLDRLER